MTKSTHEKLENEIAFKSTYQINKEVIIILWISSMLMFVMSFFAVNKSILFPVSIILTGVTILISVLHKKKILTNSLKYFVFIILLFNHSVYLFILKDVNGIIMAFVSIFLISLYNDSKLVIVSYITQLSFIYLGFVSESADRIFGVFNTPSGLLSVTLTFTLICVLLVSQSRLNTKIKIKLVKDKEQAEESNIKLKKLFDIVKGSISILTEIGITLNDNINTTNKTAHEFKTTFTNIQNRVISEVSSLEKLHGDLIIQNDEIVRTKEESSLMKDLTKISLSTTEQVSEDIINLKNVIENIYNKAGETNSSLNDLVKHSDNIKAILDSINKISEQINLLSLNASIEAARAGEHGKGFMVVAREVGNLAIESKKSTNSIADTLNKLSNQINIVSSQMYSINEFISTAEQYTAQVNNSFKNITNNSEVAVTKSNNIDIICKNTSELSQEFKTNITTFVDSLNNISTVLYDSMNTLNTQDDKISNLVDTNKELNNLLVELKEIVN